MVAVLACDAHQPLDQILRLTLSEASAFMSAVVRLKQMKNDAQRHAAEQAQRRG
jgi:hypothetical protein